MEEGASKKGPPRREVNMAISKAQQASVNKYVKSNYDRINVTMPKGRRDVIKAHAEAHSESVNAFINRAIEEAMERDNTPSE
jgi:predicted HicB family RNase H-like nuclease